MIAVPISHTWASPVVSAKFGAILSMSLNDMPSGLVSVEGKMRRRNVVDVVRSVGSSNWKTSSLKISTIQR